MYFLDLASELHCICVSVSTGVCNPSILEEHERNQKVHLQIRHPDCHSINGLRKGVLGKSGNNFNIVRHVSCVVCSRGAMVQKSYKLPEWLVIIYKGDNRFCNFAAHYLNS